MPADQFGAAAMDLGDGGDNRQTEAGALRWLVKLDKELLPDITVVARMDMANQNPAQPRCARCGSLPALSSWSRCAAIS